MDITLKQVSKAAKGLIDNSDFNMVLDYMENSLMLTLTNGSPESADNNLRNLKAANALKQGVGLLANMPDDD